MSDLGKVSAYVRQRLAALLDERRVVVWYDPEHAFAKLLPALDVPGCVIVSAADSQLRARREAEAVYRKLDEPGMPAARSNLLVYIPAARGVTLAQQEQDPFEGFARCGAAFGDKDAEQLLPLAQLALPERSDEIARLFRDSRPTLAMLDALPAGGRYPLVGQALGAESPVEAVAAALARENSAERLQSTPGALGELARLAKTEFGLAAGPADTWPALRDRLFRYLLVSELAFDLPAGLPSALAAVPHSDPVHRQVVFDVCDRLRESDAGREAYAATAPRIESELHLAPLLAGAPSGSRDTFPREERARLGAVVSAAVSGNLADAHSLFAAAEGSIWRRQPERALVWQVTQRCLAFLELALAAEDKPLPSGVRSLIEAYAAGGLWQLDHAQRLYEQTAAQCAQDDEVEPLIRHCRARYRAVVDRPQIAFQGAVKNEGWPPEGIRRQAQVFDACVAPELAERHRTAYFLVDSLRYEMGRDLAEKLRELGAVSMDAATTVLPTTTPCGMAALLPGADGALALVAQRGDLVPAIAGTPLPAAAERKAFLASRFGDRCLDITLDELLSIAPARLRGRIGDADLLVVRTPDIDALGEGTSLFRARKVMSEVIGELYTAAVRLSDLRFQTLVFAADHGHLLMPDPLPGDKAPVPAGDWPSKKRRSLLGAARVTSAPGVLILTAANAGIVAPVADLAVATGFKTFQEGAGYFHEGLSIQECLVPVIVLRSRARPQAAPGEQVTIAYRSDRFTSSVVGLKLQLTALLSSAVSVRVEAFADASAAARAIGEAADCDARDPATGEILLRNGEEAQVPLVIDPDFAGPSIEVRASDPRTGVILARLTLKNARMD